MLANSIKSRIETENKLNNIHIQSGSNPKDNIIAYVYGSFDELNKLIEVEFVKVKGHSNNKWNDIADTLAKKSLGK